MDANYFRVQAQTCRRLANDLRWNNPARFHLMDLAEDFQKRAELAEQQGTGRSREEALGQPLLRARAGAPRTTAMLAAIRRASSRGF